MQEEVIVAYLDITIDCLAGRLGSGRALVGREA